MLDSVRTSNVEYAVAYFAFVLVQNQFYKIEFRFPSDCHLCCVCVFKLLRQ